MHTVIMLVTHCHCCHLFRGQDLATPVHTECTQSSCWLLLLLISSGDKNLPHLSTQNTHSHHAGYCYCWSLLGTRSCHTCPHRTHTVIMLVTVTADLFWGQDLATPVHTEHTQSSCWLLLLLISSGDKILPHLSTQNTHSHHAGYCYCWSLLGTRSCHTCPHSHHAGYCYCWSLLGTRSCHTCPHTVIMLVTVTADLFWGQDLATPVHTQSSCWLLLLLISSGDKILPHLSTQSSCWLLLLLISSGDKILPHLSTHSHHAGYCYCWSLLGTRSCHTCPHTIIMLVTVTADLFWGQDLATPVHTQSSCWLLLLLISSGDKILPHLSTHNHHAAHCNHRHCHLFDRHDFAKPITHRAGDHHTVYRDESHLPQSKHQQWSNPYFKISQFLFSWEILGFAITSLPCFIWVSL